MKRAVPAAVILREPAAWLAQHSQYTPRGGFSIVTAPSAAPNYALRNRRAPALKFRSSLFKGLRVKGRALVARRNGRNSPAFCFGKKEAWRKSPLFKGATFSIPNSIRAADTSLETFKRTCNHDMHSDIHIYMQNRHTNAACISTSTRTRNIHTAYKN